MEDFGAFAIHESQGNDADHENGNIYSLRPLL